ncbi:hypothetical protein J5N97_015228 [Dioscorea zingiberensis]|uniref:Uncharacterized protein n=1 Tax=Dioscorea zingiberensis TaxID=325984 RepID=A0A9D5CVP2_9LILI|nr:hypothetical protein J5N97_015228 [Dioscorea zingiberensis]
MNETQEQKQPHPTNNIPTSGPSHQEETSKDHVMAELAKAVNAVACAIQKSHAHWIENLANVVWEMEGYDDDDLEMVYDELCRDKGKARGFTYKLPSMRKS